MENVKQFFEKVKLFWKKVKHFRQKVKRIRRNKLHPIGRVISHPSSVIVNVIVIVIPCAETRARGAHTRRKNNPMCYITIY